MSHTSRIDVVFIRKSSPQQDEKGQADNVQKMLKARQVYIPDDRWIFGVVSRRKVKSNQPFTKLLDMVQADRVGTVYIESQDRWGTSDRAELFALLSLLREHSTRLFDLRAGKDLTEKDFATEMMAIITSFKSEKELADLSYRSLRTRVSLFMESGSWPTGVHPFGYGKQVFTAEGKLLFVWQPIDQKRGQAFYPDAEGNLIPSGPPDAPIPRKSKGKRERTQLVPSTDPSRIRAVQLVYDLYTRVGLSRRQISGRLNDEGLTFYGEPFTHQDVSGILANPAYMGDTYFGKTVKGGIHTFTPRGEVVKAEGKRESKFRDRKECLVRQDTHVPLVDRKTWQLAWDKLQAEEARPSWSPRNPAFFLKTLLVCGHCKKGMIGRMEHGQPGYICPTYSRCHADGRVSPCGYHKISHADAEQLLLDKIRELNLPLEEVQSNGAGANLQARLDRLGIEDEAAQDQWQTWVMEGIDALVAYLVQTHPEMNEWPTIQRIRRLASRHYWGELDSKEGGIVESLRKAVKEVEEATVKEANQKLATLRQEHRTLTLSWAKASEEMQSVLKAEIDQLEVSIREWEPRTVPLSTRLEQLYAAEAERQEERDRLLAEWPTLEAREKGEALRRLFKTVSLFWSRTWHPVSTRYKGRKTNRKGNWSYQLELDRTLWTFAESDLVGSSGKATPSGAGQQGRG